MAGENQLSLEVLIRTIADSRGLKATEQDVKQLAKSLDDASRATGKLETSADEIERALRKQSTAAGEVTDAQKQAAQAAVNYVREGERVAEALKRSGGAAAAGARDIAKIRAGAQDATQVFRGLADASEGGAQGMYGLINAGRGALNLFRAIGGVLVGPVGLGLGAAAAGIAYLGRVAKQNQAAIEKVFAEAAKGSEQLKKEYAELEEAGKKSIEAQIEEVGKLGEKYQELLGMMDAVEQRNAKLNKATTDRALAQVDLAEQQALAKATTPEERAKIAAQFATQREGIKAKAEDADLENQRFSAQVRRQNAQETEAKARQQLDAARLDARLKKDAAADALANVQAAAEQFGVGSAPHRQALAEAKARQREADIANANFGQVESATGKVFDTARAQRDSADLAEKLAGISRETLTTQRATTTQQRLNALRPKLIDEGALGAQIAEAQRKRQSLEVDRSASGASYGAADTFAPAIAEQTRTIESLTQQLVAAQMANGRAIVESQRQQIAIAKGTQGEVVKQQKQQENLRVKGR